MHSAEFVDPSTARPWPTRGMPLQLSRKFAAAALPSRRFPKPVPNFDSEAVFRELRGMVVPDIGGTDAELRPALEEAWDRLRSHKLDGSPASDAVLLLLATSHEAQDRFANEASAPARVVDIIASRKSLEYCVDAYIAMHGMALRGRYERHTVDGPEQYTVTIHRGNPGRLGVNVPLVPIQVAMRGQLASAPETAWTACADKIENLIASAPLMLRAGLAVLLPERPSVSNSLARQLSAAGASKTAPLLLLTADDPDLLGILSADYGHWCSNPMLAATLLQERGVDALPVLEIVATGEVPSEALVQVGTPESIKTLAGVVFKTADSRVWTGITHKTAVDRLAAALQLSPLAGIVALAEIGEQPGRDGEMMRAALSKLLLAHAGQVPQILTWTSPAAQELVQRLHAANSAPVQVASMHDLPKVLASPPWLLPRKKSAAVLALQPLALAPVERWDDIDREEWERLDAQQRNYIDEDLRNREKIADVIGFRWVNNPRDIEAREMARKAIECGDMEGLAEAWSWFESNSYFRYVNAHGLAVLPGDLGVEIWTALASKAGIETVPHLLSKFGLRAVPGFEELLARRTTDAMPLARCFGSVGMAAHVARAAVRLKKQQEEARQWLLRFPDHAICGLIAPAVGKAGEDKECAMSALRFLRLRGHEALIFETAGRYEDPAVAASLRALLDEDPLERLPAKIPKLSDFWAPHAWRRPVLNDTFGASAGMALPNDALDRIGTMLMFPAADGPYAGIAQVKEACTAESLADFGWDCFMAWLNAGGHSKSAWAMSALGWLGTDDTARKLTPYIRGWPSESQHLRAVAALDVLANIGSEVALMQLNGIAQKAKNKPLQDKAREKIGKMAEALELTTEQLEDRLAPELGLDENGSIMLDFGPRQFLVGFDEALKPYVRDGDGKRLPDLPKPKQTDDEALAKAAVERFKLLKKDVRTVASQQVMRLEWAMCSRRRWSAQHFRQFLVEHPLVRHLVQRLVWGVYALEAGEARLLQCFRVAEDASYTTGDDQPFSLPEVEVEIGLPHAIELPPHAAAQFGQLFADYELLQPFAQLGRDTYALGDEDRAAQHLERWKGVVVPSTRVLGLVNKGWQRGASFGGGTICFFHKPLAGGKVIELSLNPGIYVGMVSENPEQNLEVVAVGSSARGGEVRSPESFATLDPVVTSELIRDLESLRA
jgi:hypothetical protein